MAAKKRKKKYKTGKIAALILILFIAVIALLCVTVLFKVADIKVETGVYTSEQIIEASDISIGDNLVTLSESEISGKISEKLPYVKSVTIKRTFPDKLTIKVNKAKPYAAFKIDNEYYLVNNSLKVLEKNDKLPNNIFAIIGAKLTSKDVGKEVAFKDNKQHTDFTQAMSELKKYKISVSVLHIERLSDMSVVIENKYVAKLGSITNLKYKVKMLASSLKKLSEGQTGVIDLTDCNEMSNPNAVFKKCPIDDYLALVESKTNSQPADNSASEPQSEENKSNNTSSEASSSETSSNTAE